MAEPTLIQMKTALAPASILAGNRLRPVSEAGVLAILGSVQELGQIVTPLVVRQRRDKGAENLVYELLDGAHRLEVARRLGLELVPVRVFECTNDQARLLEIDGNLAGAELNPLDTAVFLATRKAVYERLHPETKAGVAGGLARQGSANELSSFAEVTAEKFGMTARQVQKIVAAGSKLGPDEIAALRAAPRQVTLKDLQDIAQIKEPTARYGVVGALAKGRAKNAAAALKALKAPVEGPEKSPADEQLSALLKAWDRAGMAALRRFVSERFDALSPLMMAEAEVRDGADSADRGEAA